MSAQDLDVVPDIDDDDYEYAVEDAPDDPDPKSTENSNSYVNQVQESLAIVAFPTEDVPDAVSSQSAVDRLKLLDPILIVDLFSGVGAMSLAVKHSLYRSEILLLVEWAAFPMSILRRNFPGVRLVSDICMLESLPVHHLLLLGFPCPGNSYQGVRFGHKMEGVGNEHTGLLLQAVRLLTHGSRPSSIVIENPLGILSSSHDGKARGFFPWLVDTLVGLGYTRGEWRVLHSGDNAYNRDRLYLVCWRVPAILTGVLLSGGFLLPDAGPGFSFNLKDPKGTPAVGRLGAMIASAKAMPSVAIPVEGDRWRVVELAIPVGADIHGLPDGYLGKGSDAAQLKAIGNGTAGSCKWVVQRVVGTLCGEELPPGYSGLVPGVEFTLEAGPRSTPTSGRWEVGPGPLGFRAFHQPTMKLVNLGPRSSSSRDLVSLVADLRPNEARDWTEADALGYFEKALDTMCRTDDGKEIFPIIKAVWPMAVLPKANDRVEVHFKHDGWFTGVVSICSPASVVKHVVEYIDDGQIQKGLLVPGCFRFLTEEDTTQQWRWSSDVSSTSRKPM